MAFFFTTVFGAEKSKIFFLMNVFTSDIARSGDFTMCQLVRCTTQRSESFILRDVTGSGCEKLLENISNRLPCVENIVAG